MFISLSDIDHNTAEELQNFVKNKDQKWMWVTASYWSYRIPNKTLFFI